MNSYSNRGMIKWAPFKSLNEQSQYLQKMRKDKARIEMPILLEDEQEEINRVLQGYKGGEIHAKYYRNGEILQIQGVIQYLDIFAKRLRIKGIDIPF